VWRLTRASAAELVDEFRARATRETDEAMALLGVRKPVRSDEWLLFAARLGLAYRHLAHATYCLYEWAEPDDASADIDNYQDAGDERLDKAVRDRLRSLRSGRRNIGNLKDHDQGQSALAVGGLIITVPAEMVSELRNGLHTVLGDTAQDVSRITDDPGRERHPEWYAEHRKRFERTWALLDLIGWGEPKQPGAIRIDLRRHRRPTCEALRVRLQVGADDLREADAVDAERAKHGEPPKREATTTRVNTLREFAATVKDLVDRS
jgi:hypothetical protein